MDGMDDGKHNSDNIEVTFNTTNTIRHEQGVCPVCNSENLEYGSSDFEGDAVGYDWTCEDCGSYGMEWYELTFSNHNVTHNTKENKQ